MARFKIYQAAGWHGRPVDPVIEETDDREYAGLRAGLVVSLGIPGDCNERDAYALDEDGQTVQPIKSFQCGACGRLVPWGDGPVGTMDGRVLECPQAIQKHLVTWVCDQCAMELEEEDD